jgi:hypothetical protein
MPHGRPGKLAERQQARQLRRTGLPLSEIALRVGSPRAACRCWGREVRQHRSSDGRVLLCLAPAVLRDRRGTATSAAYLHEGLDLAASIAFWSALTSIPPSQFQKPYRAVPDPTIRRAKHVHGCVSIDYSCSATHRSIMGLVIALLGDAVNPG